MTGVTKFLPYLLLVPVAMTGGYFSTKAHDSPRLSLLTVLLTALCGGFLWWWACRLHALSYAVSSVLYNLTYEGSYFLILVILSSDPIAPRQWVGVGLAVLAGYLLSS